MAIESTVNWYWLVDGLRAKNFPTMLVNTAAIQQYEALKRSDDQYDAWWLAHMMRLGILPTGHIYPREQRAVRDLLRKRAMLVQQRTANVLSVQNLEARNRGTKTEQTRRIERTVLAKARLRPEFKLLLTIWGIGEILGLTIMYEAGDMSRFAGPGHFASYCRCVDARRRSHALLLDPDALPGI